MIVLRSFSENNIYFPEDDYLDEIMYSSEDEDLSLSNKDKAKLGMLGATGVGLATAGTGHLVRRSGVNTVHKLIPEWIRNVSSKGTRQLTKDGLKYVEGLYKTNPKGAKAIIDNLKNGTATTNPTYKKLGKGIKRFIVGGKVRKAGLITAGLGGLGYAALKLSDHEGHDKRK